MVLVYCVFLVMWCAIAARCNYEAQALLYGTLDPAIAIRLLVRAGASSLS